ncbi:MAG: UDP-N-acetylglucosamine diphosphorylase/glucosamine-1-phosphate N-acetyltransferase [Proteobacteria bacterium]|nr:MAG: UDP-N-acetylglucosamine diphosphorylase/glucosamine-1-phosphate N-acetyltransferase [Pseudomonadota bacterium]
MENIAIVILAAGLGRRMESDLPKAAVKTADATLIEHVLHTASALNPRKIIVVTGHGREILEEVVRSSAHYDSKLLGFAYQAKQLGTADAVKAALPELKGFTGTILILCADTPLIRTATLRALLDLHYGEKSTITLLTALLSDPKNYGRVVRESKSGHVQEIVEAKDCAPHQLAINEINVGIYAVDSSFLSPAIEAVENTNAQGEYYLTDIVAKAVKEGQRVAALRAGGEQEALGVNDLYDLALVNKVLYSRRAQAFAQNGVCFIDPCSVYIDREVQISQGASVGPQVQLRGTTTIGAGATIEGSAILKDCKVGAGAQVKFGVSAEGAVIGEKASVGPFVHLRPGTELGAEVKIGNFVETKKAKLARGAKASHLTYLGDCEVGENTNIGAGTITCNYDGYNKFETKIGKGVFIGSNTSLVAPITVEDGSTIGAGSVITKKVEKDSLAFTRPEQVSKAGWSKRKREQARKGKG